MSEDKLSGGEIDWFNDQRKKTSEQNSWSDEHYDSFRNNKVVDFEYASLTSVMNEKERWCKKVRAENGKAKYGKLESLCRFKFVNNFIIILLSFSFKFDWEIQNCFYNTFLCTNFCS